MLVSSATVTSTSYPALPNISAQSFGGGRWSVFNPDATIPVFVSVDGISDTARVGSIGDVTTRATQLSVAPTLHQLSAGDVVQLRVANLDDVDDFIVSAGSLAAMSSGC